MAHCCSQCSFTAQFESALIMHHQLHHENLNSYQDVNKPKLSSEKSNTLPLPKIDATFSGSKDNKGLPARTSSATKLFEKIRSRIGRSRSRTLFSHPEEIHDSMLMNDASLTSQCTSKAMNSETKSLGLPTSLDDKKETFGCHLCSFDADRITVLDRHLLNDHKIGLENLLKLVMAKTKDGLADENTTTVYGIRQPYYKQPNEMIEEGEFVIETVTPKIKILKHSGTNTDIQWSDIPDLKDNCKTITKELEKLIKYPTVHPDKEDLLAKMQRLSNFMCKFVDSTNTMKEVLAKEYESKSSVRDRLSSAEPFFEIGLGDQESPCDWVRSHSDRVERARHKYGDSSKGGKSKLSSESFYF